MLRCNRPTADGWLATDSLKTTGQGMHSTIGAYHSGYRRGGGEARGLIGELNSVRFYNRVLNDEELRWNRMVDEQRFGGAAATNVVVAGECPEGMTEQPGGYKVEGRWTFTARDAFVAPRGRLMRITGYTVEPGDAASGTWGTPEEHEGGSFTYTDGQGPSLIRLTWRWKSVGGMSLRFR